MPLSPLTRLRGAIIVAIFALLLFRYDGATFGVLPLLLWFLVSNAVKEAPPFDESAFHRTRPVSAARAFRHLMGFHLLVFAGILVVLLSYAWHMNLGWRQIAYGTALLGAPGVVFVSLFATIASLSTSNQHWKGWGFVALVLMPAISIFGLERAISARWYEKPSLHGLPIVAAVLYPALWWYVSTKRRWAHGIFMGLAAGVALPWIFTVHMPPLGINLLKQPPLSGLTIQRLTSSADAEGMAEDQASVSRLLEIRGLGPDEFIGGISLWKLREREHARGPLEADRNLSDMGGTAFATDTKGLLIPATASLFHAMGLETTPPTTFPVWDWNSSELNAHGLATFLWLPIRAGKDPYRRRETFDSAERTWSMGANIYRWERLLDTTAKKGGRVRLRSGGVVEMLPIEARETQFEITARSTRGLDLQYSGHLPALVATGRSGIRRFVKCDGVVGLKGGFLVEMSDLQFRAPRSKSQIDDEVTSLENMRLELYWPVLRGSVNVTLPPP